MHFLHCLPLFAAFVVALPAAKLHVDTCTKNPVLSIVRALHASAFCTRYLHITTKTVVRTATKTVGTVVTTTSTSTLTAPRTATTSTTTTAVQTSVVFVPGQTLLATTTLSIPVTSISTASTSTILVTTTETAYTYAHIGGIAKRGKKDCPPALRAFASHAISTACQCYVTTPTVTRTTTSIARSTSTVTIKAVATTSLVVKTVVETATAATTTAVTSTGPDTSTTATATASITTVTTTTATATSFATVSTTVAGDKSFQLVATFNTFCTPFNYLDLRTQFGASTYSEAFQYCAQLCATTECDQIWVSSGLWCLTGSNSIDYMHWEYNEIQCNYPPIGQFAEWYSLV